MKTLQRSSDPKDDKDMPYFETKTGRVGKNIRLFISSSAVFLIFRLILISPAELEFNDYMDGFEIGQTVTLKIFRGQKVMTIKVRLEGMPHESRQK